MSTQGILISSDSNIDQHEINSRGRSLSAASAISLSLGSIVDQENRHRNNTSKSPGKVLKPQIISPRLLVTHKNLGTLPNNGKSNTDSCGSLTKSSYNIAITDRYRMKCSNDSSKTNECKNSLSSSNPVNLPNSANTNIGNLISNNDTKPVYRSTSSHTQSSQQQKISIKRFTTNPKSPPAIVKYVDNRTPPQFMPMFPPAPPKPEKFIGRTDKLAYKIWMKKRAKYEKWESAKTLFDMNVAEGNVGACHKILARLDEELEELTKAISEDECRRLFPEEPTKPAEFCPSNIKEAKIWYQQMVMYEAWEKAFMLFQENSAKGDVCACRKLVDIIQMTLHNPSYKSDLAPSQLLSSRRATETSGHKSVPDLEPYISKPLNVNVKFAPEPSQGSIPSLTQTTSKISRPKLKPPASWTKHKGNPEKEKNNEKSSHVAFAEVAPQEVRFTHEGDDLILLHALDLELDDLKSSLDNYFTLNQN